ncbi:MAG: hypothetical protein LH624_13190 [Cryobacterium sp.]|nr:hypothetical protein [Cryobacterium sp.]
MRRIAFNTSGGLGPRLVPPGPTGSTIAARRRTSARPGGVHHDRNGDRPWVSSSPGRAAGPDGIVSTRSPEIR